jgi:hypothetical protein
LFGHLKFFDPLLGADDESNYYMEREWRVAGSVNFKLSDLARVIVTTGFESRLRDEFPDLCDRVTGLEAA